jgi:hypothetical protein
MLGGTELMKSSRPLFYQCRVVFVLVGLVLLGLHAHADISDDDSGLIEEVTNPSGKVEIQYEAQALAPYRERRGSWSAILGLNVSAFQPRKYYSRIDGRSFGELFGENQSIYLGQMQLGAQYNFALGSIGSALDIGYGQAGGSSRALDLIKEGVSLTYTMNNLWAEPYIAPYISGELLRYDYNDHGDGVEGDQGATSLTTAFTVGVLVQLNWIDPESALDARNSSGLENIFLDVFASQYNTSQSESDINLQSDLNWGAGLRLEF